MSLPQDIINEIFSWIDISFIYNELDDTFRIVYYNSNIFSKAVKQLFLQKKQLFEKYAILYMMYKNITLTNKYYFKYDKSKNTFKFKDNNLMLITYKTQLNKGL